jgi:hypothetical protein
MVAVEILNRNVKMSGQGNFEIKDSVNIKEVATLIDQAQNWPDRLIELELWTNLCVLASKANQTDVRTDVLKYCHSKALETLSYFEKRKTDNK